MTKGTPRHPHPLDGRFEHLIISSDPGNPGVATVTLDRPRKRNAINSKMWSEIGEAFRLLGSTGDGTRCVLLRGSGRAFCAGIDTSDPSFGLIDAGSEGDDGDEEDGDGPPDVARRYLSFRPKILEMQGAISALESCPVPVVAAVHGPCVGAGVDLITAADVRLCSPSSVFSVREARIGLTADVGTLQRFPKVVGHGSRVRELCFTGEDFDAEEAERIGLVSRVTQSDASLIGEAMDVCRRIARNSPVAVAGTKLSLNYSRDHTVADGLEHIAAHNAAALMTGDIVASFVASAGGGDGEVPLFAKLMPHARL
uniref:3-hydroxyisobutyryl-coenzyme A hydrolase n=1 Tax=Odontella aurita TaxID=265563 RepID=A0A7S4IG97_9STRA|mmetsp:Transcript_24775/g.72572  ORF Transcript_24775/g.72572 Transcript_24775/m.72572 type:complete len:312 (+) Transcript_24775:36-971(+)